jgi:uncharacterized protein DUF6804
MVTASREGGAGYAPENEARAERVMMLRLVALKGTPLGARLFEARMRRRLKDTRFDDATYKDDPQLSFQFLNFQKTPGLEMLAEETFGGYVGVDPYMGRPNDWPALELQQAREIEQAKLERWDRESREAPAPPVHEMSTPAPIRTSPGAAPVPTALLRPSLLPLTVVTAMLVWALLPTNPYSYYILLRWICCPILGYLAWLGFSRGMQNWGLGLAIGALLYNPLLPVFLNRAAWSFINVLTIAAVLAFARVARRQ